MELRQLTYFEAVARFGGFTRAAERLHVAQSAVSAQIRALETELGTELFTRTTRRVALTEAGELFLARSRRALAEIDGARNDLADLAAVLTGRVTLGATAVVGGFDLPGALSGFHARYPGVSLNLRSGLIAALLTELDAGMVDLVVGPAHADLPSRFSAHRIAREQVVLIVSPEHHLAGGTALPLPQLRDEPFVCLPPGSGLRAILDEAAHTAGFAPQVPFEAATPASIRELVAAGLGVALLARTAAEAPGPAIAIRQLTPTPTHPDIAVIHHRDHRMPAAAQACRRHLIELAAGV
ncbi:DNA-binding transcriptional LysR family regulator [Actinoplanes tereljensis]|uniref:LysR family transcriptional regulator n=1 Tax=Paractinoplanes tereljensis TaxID=571912 RepID=A0A919NW34_9ACTN|nr:LysR family transcriptional regulator [Actinoplanes tereljensis]GIF26379.1 LysR family transcriptional regulator [Actinoplanes tereljensis]